MASGPIPHFFLYGEPPQQAADQFLHIEGLAERSLPNNWNIRPHVHQGLHHLFNITCGHAAVSFDGQAHVLAAPVLLLVPAGTVHAFDFSTDADGSVMTLADSALRGLTARQPALASLLQRPSWLQPDAEHIAAAGLNEAFARLGHELAWDAPGHDAAVESQLTMILVSVLRLAQGAAGADTQSQALGPQARLVARFRDEVERRFRTAAGVVDYADLLGVTPRQLRTACVQVAQMPPIQLIRQRTALEARRLLTYSTMSIAEVSYSLGFEDQAYFSRVFSAEAGCSPRAFRMGRRGPGAVAA
jgi:AraC family transcriptional activator of pobA